jgi:hemin uptake protein HemP
MFESDRHCFAGAEERLTLLMLGKILNLALAHDPRLAIADASDHAAKQARDIAITNDRIESRDLFVGTREIIIGHGDDVYRLRLTAQNKLILTK